MNLRVVQRILGILLMLFSLTMLPPLVVSLYYADGNWRPFLEATLVLLFVGFAVWLPAASVQRELRLRDGFLVVSLFWIVLGIAGAAPLVLSKQPQVSITDAVFEAVSGFTTTGATVLVGLDAMPPSLLYYRQQIQWFGGIGIVVLAVALLPMLRVGGMQLLKAEAPGPMKDKKLTPRITGTAKVLWLVYIALTLACALAYWMAGMTLFDAIGHSLSTLSTGGFSTHDASLAYFKSPAIEAIAIVFMFAGGVNFALHYVVWRHRSVREYLADTEFRVFLGILVGATLLYTLILALAQVKPDSLEAFRVAIFQVVSIQTSTGFLTDDFTLWPAAIPMMLILSTFISGCAGSTAGGMKTLRWVLIWKQGYRELQRALHPSAIIPVKIGGKAVELNVIQAVWGFFAVYVGCFVVLLIALMATGEDQITAFSAIATCMNNTGPGLGKVAANFAAVSDAGKWTCTLAMLLGRLEVFPLLVLVTATFWRK